MPLSRIRPYETRGELGSGERAQPHVFARRGSIVFRPRKASFARLHLRSPLCAVLLPFQSPSVCPSCDVAVVRAAQLSPLVGPW